MKRAILAATIAVAASDNAQAQGIPPECVAYESVAYVAMSMRQRGENLQAFLNLADFEEATSEFTNIAWKIGVAAWSESRAYGARWRDDKVREFANDVLIECIKAKGAAR